MSSAFEGLLTRNDAGELFHCGERIKWAMCNECYIDGCFTAYCWNWECGWDSPDCCDMDEDPLTVLEILPALAAGACLAVVHS